MRFTRARRVLLVAFVVSLLVHLVLLAWLRRPLAPVQLRSRTTIARLRMVRILRTAPPPTPPPTPAPAASPVRHVAAQRVTRAAPRSRAAAREGSSVSRAAIAAATPTAPPVPRATACAVRNAPAALSASPPPPPLDPATRAQDASGTAQVLVHLDAQGGVRDATVLGSSGSAALDVVALQMARDASYAPAYAGCKAVAGTYVFRVTFAAW